MVLRGGHNQNLTPGPSTPRSKFGVAAAGTSKLTSSPFAASPGAGLPITPQKVTDSPGDARLPKPPEKPLMPYMRYRRKMWDQVKTENPEKKMWEIGSIIGQLWRELSEDIKNEYCEEYEIEKVEYERRMKVFENSPDFLTQLSKKTKGRIKDRAPAEEKSTAERPTAAEKVAPADRKIEIQPAEDDDVFANLLPDMTDGLTARHIAYARYIRNYRLMSEIFSDTVVPDTRAVISSGRIEILKRQVESLNMHQRKLERELQIMEDKYEAKRRKFNENKEQFNAELKKMGVSTEK